MTSVIVGVDLSDTTTKTLAAVSRLATATDGLTVRPVHVPRPRPSWPATTPRSSRPTPLTSEPARCARSTES
jgi:hypothetical protein